MARSRTDTQRNARKAALRHLRVVWIAAALVGLGGVGALPCSTCASMWDGINYCATFGICELWCTDVCVGDIIPGGKDGFIAAVHTVVGPIKASLDWALSQADAMTAELSDGFTLAETIHEHATAGFAALGHAIDEIELLSGAMTGVGAPSGLYSLKQPLLDLTAHLTDGFADVDALLSDVGSSLADVGDALGDLTVDGSLLNGLRNQVGDAQDGVLAAFDSASRLFETHAAFLESAVDRTFSDILADEVEMLGNLDDHAALLLASVGGLRSAMTDELAASLADDFGTLGATLSHLGDRLDRIAARLVVLAPKLSEIPEAVAVGNRTEADIEQGLAALNASIEAGFAAIAAQLEVRSARADPSVSGAVEIARLEQQLAQAQAEHAALLHQQRDLQQVAFHGNPVRALQWLVESDRIQLHDGGLDSTDPGADLVKAR